MIITELELQVLLAVGNGASHGYAIGKHIEATSAGRVDPTTGAIYQAIRRLSAAGLLQESAPPENEPAEAGPRRKYFARTAAGRRTAEAELARLEQLVNRARKELRGVAGA